MATIVTGVIVGVTSLFTSLDAMVNLTNIGTLFAFMLVCIGVIILRFKDPDRERGFRVPGGALFFPLLGAVSCVGLAWYFPPDSWARFIIWLAVGLLFYFFYGFKHSRLRMGLEAAGRPPTFNPAGDLPPTGVESKNKPPKR